jgi:hypothetical protein
LGEEGFAPAGSIFAAGVLAFAAAVPAVAFSPLGVPAASNDEIGAAARVSAKAKVHVLFSITLPPWCRAVARRQGFNAKGEWGCGYHLLCLTVISSKPNPDNAARRFCVCRIAESTTR